MMQQITENTDGHNDHLQYVGQVNEFITKTFDMIEYCHSRYPDIVSWSDDGSQFFVKDSKRLGSEVIPKYFNHKKYSSFFRQLNFYNFKKTNSNKKSSQTGGNNVSPQYIIYEHDFFKRDQAELLPRIKRSTYRKRKGDLSKDIDQFQRDLDSMNQEIEEMEENFERAIENVSASLDKKLNQLDTLLQNKRRKIDKSSSAFAPTKSKYSRIDVKDLPLPNFQEKVRQTSNASFFSLADLIPTSRQGSVDSNFIANEIDKNWGLVGAESILSRQGSTNSASWFHDFAEDWS